MLNEKEKTYLELCKKLVEFQPRGEYETEEEEGYSHSLSLTGLSLNLEECNKCNGDGRIGNTDCKKCDSLGVLGYSNELKKELLELKERVT